MRINEVLKTFRSADGDDVPRVLFHGTLLETWENYISKYGLEPEKSINRGENTKGYIFLGWSSAESEEFTPGGTYGLVGDKRLGAVIQVNLTEDIAKTLRTALGEYIRCPVNIPPNRLKLIKITNKRLKK